MWIYRNYTAAEDNSSVGLPYHFLSLCASVYFPISPSSPHCHQTILFTRTLYSLPHDKFVYRQAFGAGWFRSERLNGSTIENWTGGSNERHPQVPRTTYSGLSITTDSMEHSSPYNIPLTDRVFTRVFGPEMLITVLTEPATLPIHLVLCDILVWRFTLILSSHLCPYISYGLLTVGTSDETPA